MGGPDERLAAAVRALNLDEARRALDQGADPNAKVVDDRARKVPILHLACKTRHLPVVKLLLERRADPNGIVESVNLREACLYAAAPDLGIMEALLSAGADPADVNCGWAGADFDEHDHYVVGFRRWDRDDLTAEAKDLLRRYPTGSD